MKEIIMLYLFFIDDEFKVALNQISYEVIVKE